MKKQIQTQGREKNGGRIYVIFQYTESAESDWFVRSNLPLESGDGHLIED